MALSERRAESFDAAALDTGDAVTPAEIERKDRAEEVPPQLAAIRRDEAVGCRDNDVLHRPTEGWVGHFWVKRSCRSWPGGSCRSPLRMRDGGRQFLLGEEISEAFGGVAVFTEAVL